MSNFQGSLSPNQRKTSKTTLGFIVLWLLINLFQAYSTELTSDEGYYWFYASQLEWGYYDHPPFLALLIKLGYSLFPNELGVRIGGILLQGLSLVFLFKLLPENLKHSNRVYLILVAIPLFSYLTFIVFPDTPLLSFSIFYLYGYKRLLEKKDLLAAVILGIALGLMLYSKYHAVLMVFFTVLSNWKLLKEKYFWLAMCLAFFLFIPHLYWQYANDFPSFQYHLQGRSAARISLKHFWGYVPQQLGAIGPVLLLIPFWLQPKNQFERTLQFICIGTLVFFTLASFRGQVHFHWTSILIIPLIILATRFFDAEKRTKLFYWGLLPMALLMLVLRLHLAIKIFPVNNFNVDYYHGRALWAEDIQAVAKGNPVLFENNLREAPLYTFYSDSEGIALYPEARKKSQYEIWNYEDQLQGKDILIVKAKPFFQSTALKTRMGKEIHYLSMPDFRSYENIRIDFEPTQVKAEGDSLMLLVIIRNHRAQLLSFTKDTYGNVPKLYAKLKSGKEWLFYKELISESINAFDEKGIEFKIPKQDLKGKEYQIQFGFDDGVLFPSENSRVYHLAIKK